MTKIQIPYKVGRIQKIMGVPCYLVGGAVIDALRNIPNVDYDIEVINEGLALIYNRKFVKSALIFPDILKEDAKLIRMVNRFHNSLIVF